MIEEFVLRWEKNKYKLERYFRTTPQREYSDYSDIVKKLFQLCINGNINVGYEKAYEFKIDDMIVIDHGNYQGTQIFILYNDAYQPDVSDYVWTSDYYGSCSGCDTLLSISNYDEAKPNDEQIKGYMSVALHLLQKCRWLDGMKDKVE